MVWENFFGTFKKQGPVDIEAFWRNCQNLQIKWFLENKTKKMKMFG